MPTWVSLLLAPLSGAVFCLGLAPFDLWPLTGVSIAVLFWLLTGTSRPVLVAWLYGVGKFGAGASWIYVSINVYGNAPPPLALFLVVLFVALVSFLFCLPIGYLYGRLRSQTAVGGSEALLFVGCWGLLAWVSTWLLTGFPWLFAANGLLHTPMSGWLPVLGVLGTSLLFALSAVALVMLVLQSSRRLLWAGVSALPWLLGLLLGQVAWVEPGPRQTVALVQGNIDQAVKWREDQRLPNLERHLSLSAEHWDSDLLVWPEAAITMYPQQAQRVLEQLARQADASDTAFVFGIPGVERDGDAYTFYNLAMGVGEARGRFAKHHLVPFGEYVPLQSVLRGLIDFFDLPMSSSSPGARNQPNIRTQFGELAMAICYEVAYAGSLRGHAATAALLVTLSNDSWFGTSIGPLQHMQIAQTRAAENGRYLVRATNNGVTAIVDHRGHIVSQLPQFEPGVLRGEVQVMQGRTPFSYTGAIPFLVLLFGCLWPAAMVYLRPSN